MKRDSSHWNKEGVIALIESLKAKNEYFGEVLLEVEAKYKYVCKSTHQTDVIYSGLQDIQAITYTIGRYGQSVLGILRQEERAADQNQTTFCERCGSPADVLGNGGVCDRCEQTLCEECGGWFYYPEGCICHKCAAEIVANEGKPTTRSGRKVRK
jgi:hypothetical protein